MFFSFEELEVCIEGSATLTLFQLPQTRERPACDSDEPRAAAGLQARRLMKRHIDDGKQFRHSPSVQRTDDGPASTSYGCSSESRAA